MKRYLRSIIEDNTTTKGRIFDYFIQILILLSLVAFSIETFPNNSDNTIEFLNQEYLDVNFKYYIIDPKEEFDQEDFSDIELTFI